MLLRDMYPKTIKYVKIPGTPFRGVRARTQKAAPVKRRVRSKEDKYKGGVQTMGGFTKLYNLFR